MQSSSFHLMRPPAALNSTLSGLNNRMIVADLHNDGRLVLCEQTLRVVDQRSGQN
jgi:hypothetical protein